MTKPEFINLLKAILADGIGVYEQLKMTEPDGSPLLDMDGIQEINDVVQIGDGRLYIERDGNEEDGEQNVVTLLAEIERFLPEIIRGLEMQL